MIHHAPDRYGKFTYPALGSNPGAGPAPTPGSFANQPDLGGPLSFSSPDTPGMPAPSDKTAWDFLPDGWQTWEADKPRAEDQRDGFEPITQLESPGSASSRRRCSASPSASRT
jgi:phosphomethylpyrimidine synthase